MKNAFTRILPFLFTFLFVVLLLAMGGSGLIAKKVVAHLILPAGSLWLAGFTAIFCPGVKAESALVFAPRPRTFPAR